MDPRKVTFVSQGIEVAGNLYLPQDVTQKKRAAIVIGHPLGGVKEQTSGLYADKLSKLGFIALAFDAAYQGDSKGLPRYLEDPWQRAEDVKSAVTYLSTLPEVDPERIGALGICASGGYVPFAAQTDVRIKAVAGVSAVDVGELFRDGMNGSTTFEALQKDLLDSAKDRTNEGKGDAPRLTNVIPPEEVVKTLPERSLFREGFDYYRTSRAQHENSKNLMVFRSRDKLVQFSANDYLYLISPRPLLLIAGADADTFYFSEKAIQKAKEPKELFSIPGASHIDLYDKLEYVNPAVAKLAEFFTEYLVEKQ